MCETTEDFGFIRQLICNACMWLEPVLRLDFAGSQRTLNTWVGFIIDLETLPTKVDGQIAKADLVLHIILQRVGVEIEQPLREETGWSRTWCDQGRASCCFHRHKNDALA